jgi:uncharacterized membrane protein
MTVLARLQDSIAAAAPPQGDGFSRQAQAVLEEKFRRGEISREAYDRYRQDISLKPKK